MELLSGKRILITGVARPDSIALAVAHAVVRQGGEVVLAAFPRDLADATAAARSLERPPAAILPANLTIPGDLHELERQVSAVVPHLDGALHAVAFAPRNALDRVVGVDAAEVELAFRTSTHSYASLADVLTRLAPPGGASLVGLDFDSSQAWPVYNWMGPCKAALRSLNQYLARDLGRHGIRTNLVAAGPLCTRAAGGIPGFEQLIELWQRRAPLRWDPHDATAVADTACFLLSDLSRAVTGEVVHADGGAHATAGTAEMGG